MTVTAVSNDPAALTLTVTAEFDASPARIWQLWADPRQLERWWGWGFSARFTTHDLVPGGRIEHHLTGPEGDFAHSAWSVLEADPPRWLVLADAVVDDGGTPVDSGPDIMRVMIDAIDASRTRMRIEMHFPSVAAMELGLEMDMEDGLAAAMGEIDALLAEDTVSTPSA